MKFLHAADIHLDSPLAGLARRDDLPAAIVAGCTRRAFANLIDLAIAEDVAFLVIAGDLYDGDWRDFSTGLFFAEQMQRLARPCFLLRGNHDAASVITRSLPLPPNVRVFGTDRCDSFDLPELRVVLHGQSFADRAMAVDLSAGYPPSRPGWFNIGVLHTSAEGSGEHDTYAPCTVSALALKGYDYWALGHIHARQVLRERPWIVFPGNLQGRHAKETGAKGASLVTVEAGRIAAIEHRALDVLRWAVLAVDAAAADVMTLHGRLEAAVDEAVQAAEGRPVLARLVLAGEHAAGRLLEDEDELAAIARNRAIQQNGRLWIESVQQDQRAPVEPDVAGLAPLRAAFAGALDDPALVGQLLADFSTLRGQVPGPAQHALNVPADADALRQALDQAWEAAARAIAATRPA